MTALSTNTSEAGKFVFWDGTSAKNVSELYTKIKIMSPYVFRMYVNEKKNDFSSWIQKNYSDISLSQELNLCPRKGEILDCLHKAINNSKNEKVIGAGKGVFQKEISEGPKLKIKEKVNLSVPLLQVFSKQKEDNFSSAFIPENFFSNSFLKKQPSQEESKKNENLKINRKINEPEQKEIQNIVKEIMSSKSNNAASQIQNNQTTPIHSMQKTAIKPSPTINPNKKVLLDEVISFESSEPNQAQEEINAKVAKIPFASTLKVFNKQPRKNISYNNQNSNVFKEPPSIKQQENILNATKFNPLNVNDIIQKIKEVHR